MHNTPLTRRDLWAYSALALPVAFAGLPLYIHAPDYYVAEHGVSLGAIGLALLGLRLFDAVQDPLIGRLSDRYRTHRLRLMLAAALLLVIGFAALFAPHGPALLWFIATSLIATTAYSVLVINHQTLGALWRPDRHDKTRIVSGREALGLVGLLLAVLSPTLLQAWLPTPIAFAAVSGLLALAMLAAVLSFTYWQRRHPAVGMVAQQQMLPSWRTSLHAIAPRTRRFFALYGLSMLASSIPALLVIFFVRDRLEAESLLGLFLALYFLAGAASMPLWQRISRRWGKWQAWGIGMALAVMSFIGALLLGAGDQWAYAAICVLSGIAFGADLALPPSILADLIDDSDTQAIATLQFGLFAFLAKAALALASALTFPALDAAGFIPAAANTSQALLALSVAYALIPCLLKAACAWWLWRMLSLNGDHHDQTVSPVTRSVPHA